MVCGPLIAGLSCNSLLCRPSYHQCRHSRGPLRVQAALLQGGFCLQRLPVGALFARVLSEGLARGAAQSGAALAAGLLRCLAECTPLDPPGPLSWTYLCRLWSCAEGRCRTRMRLLHPPTFPNQVLPSAMQALELRWRQLLQQGRAVVAVGDYNITPAPVSLGCPRLPFIHRPGCSLVSRRGCHHLVPSHHLVPGVGVLSSVTSD